MQFSHGQHVSLLLYHYEVKSSLVFIYRMVQTGAGLKQCTFNIYYTICDILKLRTSNAIVGTHANHSVTITLYTIGNLTGKTS